MTELSRESRALLALARHRDGLSAADKDRIRNKLTRRLGAGLALGSAVTASATVAQAARTTALATVATWLPSAAKVLGIVAIAGGVTVGAVRISHHKPPPSAAGADITHADSSGVREALKPTVARQLPQPTASLQPESPIQLGEPRAEPVPAPVREGSTAKPRISNAVATVDEPAPPVATQPVDDGLSSQVAAIREARSCDSSWRRSHGLGCARQGVATRAGRAARARSHFGSSCQRFVCSVTLLPQSVRPSSFYRAIRIHYWRRASAIPVHSARAIRPDDS